MTTAKTSTFDALGVADGDAVTSANLATAGDAPSGSSLLTGVTYSVAAKMHGAFGVRVQAASGVQGFIDWSGFASTSHKGRFYYRPRAIATSTQIHQLRTAVGQAFGLTHNSSGVLNVLDAAGAGKGSSPVMATDGTMYRIDHEVLSDAAAGTIAVHMYVGDDTTAPFYTLSISGQNTRGGNITNDRIGKVSATTETGPFDFDGFAASDADLNPYGPEVVTNAPPTDNAGPDQSAVEPFDVVTLAGSGTDTDGTIVSYAWTQTAGPAVTLSSTSVASPTFTAPAAIAGATLTFQLTVTDNGGATATDTVNIVVLPHTFWMKSATGTLVPIQATRKP